MFIFYIVFHCLLLQYTVVHFLTVFCISPPPLAGPRSFHLRHYGDKMYQQGSIDINYMQVQYRSKQVAVAITCTHEKFRNMQLGFVCVLVTGSYPCSTSYFGLVKASQGKGGFMGLYVHTLVHYVLGTLEAGKLDETLQSSN